MTSLRYVRLLLVVPHCPLPERSPHRMLNPLQVVNAYVAGNEGSLQDHTLSHGESLMLAPVGAHSAQCSTTAVFMP